MNYVELVRGTLRDATSGSGRLDSIPSRGFASRVADKVRESWVTIQDAQDWTFMRWPLEVALIAGKMEYAPESMRDRKGLPSIPSYGSTTIAADEVSNWIILTQETEEPAWTLTDLGTEAGGPDGRFVYGGRIAYLDFSSFRRRYLTGATVQTGKPEVFTFRDTEPKELIVYPSPDVSGRYVLFGLCQRVAQELETDTDIPFGLPKRLHKMIKWRAVMMVHEDDQEKEAYVFAKTNFDQNMLDATRKYTPKIRVQGAIA